MDTNLHELKYEKPSELGHIVDSIPTKWLRDIDAACDAFCATRGVDCEPRLLTDKKAIYHVEWYSENRDRVLSQVRQYKLKNREKVKAYDKVRGKAYRLAHKKELLNRQRKYVSQNRDGVRKSNAARYQLNRNAILARRRNEVRNLYDWYVLRSLSSGLRVAVGFPPKLIELKRNQLRLRRALKTVKT